MDSEININAVYDKNLNFLIGSGASYGILPTLALKIKDAFDTPQTVETLATHFVENDAKRAALFMHYYMTCVRPAQTLTREAVQADAKKKKVLGNYRKFVETILQLLLRRKPLDKRCNVFTTNYDSCFALVADEILHDGIVDFVLNDGTRGYSRRFLQARNFNSYLCQTGIFERDQTSIPQINLVHLHGSVHWRKHETRILVEHVVPDTPCLLSEPQLARIDTFRRDLADETKLVDALTAPAFVGDEAATFMASYQSLPIVNPTKWKFHETVFEEHYYQMLRLLSYELEKPNSVLITFGFSFADEHILNLVKRSLSNPKLQVFICCHAAAEASALGAEFAIYPNVRIVCLQDENLDFDAFNAKVFSLNSAHAQPVEGAPGVTA